MMLSFFVCRTVDHLPEEQRSVIWRNILMDRFFEHISSASKENLSLNSSADYCENWSCIECEDKNVKTITLYNVQYGNFNVEALPSSTMKVTIAGCSQNFEIRTRSLPRNIRHINLAENRIYGSPDLTTLPEQIVEIFFSSNLMKGPISLQHLPWTLKYLYLDGNNIIQKTIWYDNLPASLAEICLTSQWKQKNIGEVRSVYPEHAVTDKKIFMGMREENVH